MKDEGRTDKRLRATTVAALRAAADAIEAGGDLSQFALEPTCISYDGHESFATLGEAEAWAEGMIEPVCDEYHPDVSNVSWGVYVAVERAHIEVRDDEESMRLAAKYRVDEWWDVSLGDAWPTEVDDGSMPCPACGGNPEDPCPECDPARAACPTCDGQGGWQQLGERAVRGCRSGGVASPPNGAASGSDGAAKALDALAGGLADALIAKARREVAREREGHVETDNYKDGTFLARECPDCHGYGKLDAPALSAMVRELRGAIDDERRDLNDRVAAFEHEQAAAWRPGLVKLCHELGVAIHEDAAQGIRAEVDFWRREAWDHIAVADQHAAEIAEWQDAAGLIPGDESARDPSDLTPAMLRAWMERRDHDAELTEAIRSAGLALATIAEADIEACGHRAPGAEACDESCPCCGPAQIALQTWARANWRWHRREET